MSARKWDAVREFALSLPAAEEDFPWGEPVIKVRRKPGVPNWRKDGQGVWGPMFLWLGRRDSATRAVAVKLGESYDQAVAVAHAVPTTTSGLGQWGWLTVPLEAAALDLLCDWVDESYGVNAPRRLVAQLDALHRSDVS